MKINIMFDIPEDQVIYEKVHALVKDNPSVIETTEEDPIGPIIAVKKYPLVYDGALVAKYNWSWNSKLTPVIAVPSALKVDIAAWGGFRLKEDPIANFFTKSIGLSLACKEARKVKVVVNVDGVLENFSFAVSPKWTTYWIPKTSPTNMTLTITSEDNKAINLFIGEICLINAITQPAPELAKPEINFSLTTEEILEQNLEIPLPFTSDSKTPALKTSGNKILKPDGTQWQGRGVNLFDTRSCNAAAYNAPNVEEVKRRVDYAVDVLGCNFLRLCLESYDVSGGRTHWDTAINDADYLTDLAEILDYIGTKTGTYVLMSLWLDPSFDTLGRPTAATALSLKFLATVFKNLPHVMFGVSNEPQNNFGGADDAIVIKYMQNCYNAIRSVAPNSIIAVQGTGGWARRMIPYVTKPIVGTNVIYECHAYNAFDPAQWFEPAKVLPVILGEFAVFTESYGSMSVSDVDTTIAKANELGVSWLAWSLHHKCPPNMLVDHGGTGIGMQLELTEWGKQVARLIKQ